MKTLSTQNYSFFRKTVHSVIAAIFTLSMIAGPTTPLRAQYISTLPKPGEMVLLSPKFEPAVLQGLTIHTENPLLFDFLVNRGETDLSREDFKQETQKLIKYFLAAMTIPENESWVNLSPSESDRIIPDLLASTEMGKQMLEQDYLLKQLASSLTNPEKELGKKFWDTVYKRAFDLYGTTEIPVNTFNKVWIMPQKAVILEQDGYAFIGSSRLKVMMAEDYEAMSKNAVIASKVSPSGTSEAKQSLANKIASSPVAPSNDIAALSSQIFRDTILPSIEKEVNEGKNFAPVRQIYNSVILAAWYKKNLKETLLGKVYADKGKINGVDIPEKDVKQKVYDQYLDAFRRGVYNLVKEDYDLASQDTLPRKYFSGGLQMQLGKGASSAITVVGITDPALSDNIKNLVKKIQAEPNAETFSKYLAFLETILKNIPGISESDIAEIISKLTHNFPNQPSKLVATLAQLTETHEEEGLAAYQQALRDFKKPQSREEIATLVTALFSSPELIARGNGLLDSLKKNRSALEALLLRIANTPKNGNIKEGDVDLPRSFFLQGLKFSLADLTQQNILLTLSSILEFENNNPTTVPPEDSKSTINLVPIVDPLTNPSANRQTLNNGSATMTYDPKDNTTFVVLQPTGQSKEINTLTGDGRVPLALVEAETQSVQGTAEWIMRVTNQLSSRQQELFNAALTAASLPNENYENYNTNPEISKILGIIKSLSGTLAVEMITDKMDKATAAQRNVLLNDALSETLLINPDFIVNAAQILGVQTATPSESTTVSQSTPDGQIIISSNNTNDVMTSIIIIMPRAGGYRSYITTADVTSISSLNLNPGQLETLLSSIHGNPGNGLMLANGEFQFDGDYVLAFAQATQLPEEGFREKMASFIFDNAKAETSPELMDVVKTMANQTPTQAKGTFINAFLPRVFTKFPALVSQFLELFPKAPSNTKRINKFDGAARMSFDPKMGTTFTIRVRSSINPSDLITSFETTLPGDLRSIAFEDFNSIAEIEKFLKMIHERTALSPENQANLLQILTKLQLTKSISLAFLGPLNNFQKEIEDILAILESNNSTAAAELSIQLIGLQDADMRKEHFIEALPGLLTTTHLIGQVANVLNVPFQAVATIKTKTDGDIVTTYDLQTDTSTLKTTAKETLVLNGDWRNTTLFDDFENFKNIAPLLEIVSKKTSLTADQQAEFFQFITNPLKSPQFDKINTTAYGRKLESFFKAARLIDNITVGQWLVQVDKQNLSAKDKKESFYVNLLPALLAKANPEFVQFTASIHGIQLKPLESAVASSTIIDDVTGEIVATLNNDILTFEFKRLPTSNPTTIGSFRDLNLEDIYLPKEGFALTAQKLRELVKLAKSAQGENLIQSVFLKTLLAAYDIEKNSQSIEEVLYTLEGETQDRVEFATQFLQQMFVLTSPKEKQEKFATFVSAKLAENPTTDRINAVAKLLGINTFSGEKIGGNFSIFYDLVNDQSEITIKTTTPGGKIVPSQHTLQGDWRGKDHHELKSLKSAAEFRRIIDTIAKTTSLTSSNQQYTLFQILDEAESMEISAFGKFLDPSIDTILAQANGLSPDSQASQLAAQVTSAQKRTIDRRDFFVKFIAVLLQAKPDALSEVALQMGVFYEEETKTVVAVKETAATQNVGGIDFNPELLDLQIKRNGRGVPLPLPMQNIDQINIEGLYPVILNIHPATIENLPFMMGTNPKPSDDKLSLAK